MREDGKTLDEIASILGYANDSSVRALLNENTAANKNKAQATAEILKKELAEKGAIDVGTGVERQLGVSTGVLQEALFILETEGYNRYGVGVPQVNDPKKRTITPVISVPEIDQREVYQNLDLVKSVGDYHSTDGGESWDKREYPASIDSSRVKILYGDEGGALKDGVIEIRRGVADLDLGDSHYAQVRILVDGTHYLKGMAMYSDDMPDGADIVFNTNKHTGTPKMDVLKKIQDDPDNPFGALIKANGQSHYIDADGNEKLSAINKLKEEGDWDKMSKNLSSQFLSKQPIQLIKKQLDLTYADAADEFSEICSLNNPTVKRKLLLDFADECDSAAVHLKAAALPRQSTQVILPLNAMKETEIFTPNYMAINQINKDHVRDVCLTARDTKNVRAVSFNFHTPYPDTKKLALTKEEKAKCCDTITQMMKEGAPVFNLKSAFPYLIENRFPTPCHQCVVMENGKLSTCGRCIDVPGLCDQCGYFFVAEYTLLFRGNPKIIIEMLHTYLKYI